MRLYTDNKGNWTGTQADAKKAWGKDMALVEVPVSKEALMKWLNKCRVVSQSHAQVSAQFVHDDNEGEVVAIKPKVSAIDESNLKLAYEQAGLARESLKRVFHKLKELKK
jgi:hypothetical protein